MRNRLGKLLDPFSTAELSAEMDGVSRQEIARWRTGLRIPNSGPNVRRIAKALVVLREREGLTGGDLAATISEVWAAVRGDAQDRRSKKRRDSDR